MLWNRSSKSLPAAQSRPAESGAGKTSVPPTQEDAHVELDRALDTLGGMFRALGRYAFDLPEADAKSTTDQCERWATHLLLRMPVPDGRWEEGDPKPDNIRRDWVAALHYVTNLRKNEQAYITKALTDLRQAIWAFVHTLNHAFSETGDSDGQVKAQLTRLKSAAHGPSTEDLKREAISVAQSIGEIFEARKQKQISQVAELGERMAALGRALEEARREVALDPLTRLYNRKSFDDQLERAVDLGGLFGQAACLLIVDVDHFKKVNDQYGHPGGDEVLRKLTGCLIRTFRRRDDTVARYGGEEFAVILRETEIKEGCLLATRLLEAVRALSIEHAAFTGDNAIRITVSVGMAQVKAHESATSWLERADRALYAAKNGGRNRLASAEE